MVDLLRDEYQKKGVGFYDLHVLARKYKFDVPKMESILSTFKGVRTHFSPTGIKTDRPLKEILKMLEFKRKE